jgi:hypothetical protein
LFLHNIVDASIILTIVVITDFLVFGRSTELPMQ